MIRYTSHPKREKFFNKVWLTYDAMEENLGITHESVKKQILENVTNDFDAFNEYIWNSIDAGAKNIDILIKYKSIVITELKIMDDGKGIDFSALKDLFGNFNTSPKIIDEHLSLPRGCHGYGRFSFIRFSQAVTWDTVYNSDKDKCDYAYSIDILRNSLNKFNPSEPKKITKDKGTVVTFKLTSPSQQKALTTDKVKDALDLLKKSIAREFCWIIELMGLNITINGQRIDCSYLIEKKLDYDVNKPITIRGSIFKIKFILWSDSLKNQSSKFYLLDSNNKEKYTDTTKLNKKNDEFHHSVYIRSDYFNDFKSYETIFEDTYKELIPEINEYLKKERRPYLKKLANNEYKECVNKKLLPHFNGFEQKIKRPLYEEVVKGVIEYAPSLIVRANDNQKKVFLQLINNLLDDEPSRKNLYNILNVLVEEDNKELLEELDKKLQKYGLRNILGTIKIIELRLEAINSLRKMTSDEKQYFSESDLQKVIEEDFWIFGEEYNLMIGAEEDDFTKLRKLYYEKALKMKPEEYEDLFVSRRQVDLFVCGIMSEGRANRNLIVEIKKPNEFLKKEHYIQIDDYKDVIMGIPEFNSVDRNHWDFILIYTDISKEHVTYFKDEIVDTFTGLTKDKGHFRIYVRKWADILADAENRLNFLKEQLISKKKKMQESPIGAKEDVFEKFTDKTKLTDVNL